MCSFIRSWADWTEERSKGRVLERWAIMRMRSINVLSKSKDR